MGTHPSTAAPCAKKRSSNPPTSADASAAGTKKQRTALAALPPADYAGEYAKSMHGRVQMGDALSESVAMLIESHLDAKDIVNVRRFAQRICDGICSFAGRAHKLSLTDYRFAMPRRAASRAFSVDDVFLRDEGDAAASSSAEERSSNGDPSDVDSSTEERSSNGDPFDVDLPEFADHRMHDFEPTECMLGDPFLLEELHAQERPYTGLTEGRVCAQGLWGERAWLSAKTTADQTQCHTARSITAACAHRLNLTTFVFCENMAEFSDAVLRLQAQFGNTRVPVMEFLVGDWCDLPTPCSPASHGVWVSMDEVSLRDAMQRSLKDTMQRAGIVVVLCEVDVVRLLDEMLAMVLSDHLPCIACNFAKKNHKWLQGLDGSQCEDRVRDGPASGGKGSKGESYIGGNSYTQHPCAGAPCFGHCAVVPTTSFKDRALQRLMDRTFLSASGRVSTPHVVIDLAQK